MIHDVMGSIGAAVVGTGGSADGYCQISGNSIITCADKGIAFTGISNQISGNYIKNTTDVAIDVYSITTIQTMVSGNYCYCNGGATGIFTDSYGIVSNNFIFNASIGIDLPTGTLNTLISGNIIRQWTSFALRMANSDRVMLIGNMASGPANNRDAFYISTDSDNVLLVGNYGEAQGGGKYAFSNIGANVTAAGNLAKGGDSPTGFTAGHNVDANSCRYIA
jgi:hypothetical protein